ncbi:bifunctional GNAT family N-acetyltransferase/(deoxy)nucleoside triphosphate pyrophosphohydrolase [Rhodopila sp.]|uniref:bifunctional GNAT family N-acetyltransferase/(deoxy)nucleoside triphosphate pyrophosphohydrolase n=1 Tax=Rhodopila sp. TaxID=2480087 RepID=UPI002BB618E6|nr:bifunctional GNAT family N-acetyltransferase/(deoxy)nucleoside triphosphate pyrophosphohydrolase [Rhodopila sp.]HVZ10180.1 bifunctional GNAT family N-acetyltransferase/(deoxy)nucleoside triphosphate pyrophosphohydrolase [Rhodopila sp.]
MPEAPLLDVPQPKAPQVEAPQVEAPQAEATLAEAPQADAPQMAASLADSSLADLRLADTPAPAFAPLKTERLTLRPLLASDAAAMHRLVNDWEVTRTLAELPYPYPRELADDWIGVTRKQIDDGHAYHLAITGHEGEKETLVGVVGLTLDRAARTGRLGYWVGKAFWGHGVATEAAGRLTRWGFANLTLDRIRAEVTPANLASCAVLRRIGFRQTGTAVRHFTTSGSDHEVLVFEATRDDVFGRPTAPPAVDGQKPLVLVVACALVDTDGRVLLARRPEGKTMAGLWEFPGGKVNAGETPEAALIRELKEEIGIDVAAACLAPFAFASHAYEGFHLLMPLFICRRWKGVPRPRENQTLAWVRATKLTEYEMPPADKPLIPLLRDFL